jgi:hypothetical protein
LQAAEEGIRTLVPNGHFYSPVVDPEELRTRRASLWPVNMPEVRGIEFNPTMHQKILSGWFPRHMPRYDFPEHFDAAMPPTQFFTCNSQFSWLDARALFVMLNELRPARMIEVGSGFSSLLTADVNQRCLDGGCHFTCIEPYPRQFLLDGVPGISELVVAKVQDVALETFDALDAGDILFIDSSHVCKTGSDVNHLYFEVIPRLRPGVFVHVHDIFLPFEYPHEWVLDENRSWNEQYLLRALLMQSNAFDVLFGSNYAHHAFPKLVATVLGRPAGKGFGGGSFWFVRSNQDC